MSIYRKYFKISVYRRVIIWEENIFIEIIKDTRGNNIRVNRREGLSGAAARTGSLKEKVRNKYQ